MRGFVLRKRKTGRLAEKVSYCFLGQSESESSRMQGLTNSKLGIESTSQFVYKLSKTEKFEIINR